MFSDCLGGEGLDVVLNDLLDGLLHVVGDGTLGDFREQVAVRGSEVSTELSLPSDDLVDGDRVEETVDTGVDDGNLDLDGERLVLALLCNDKVK